MPEHNDTINRAESLRMGLRPGKYIYKKCVNSCGNGLWILNRRYTSSRICKDCLNHQLRE